MKGGKKFLMPYEAIVVGSLVVDIAVWLDRPASPGETLLAREGGIFVGGKGVNQAGAFARLGGSPLLVGALGDDVLGAFMRTGIRQELGSNDGIFYVPDTLTSYAIPVITPGSQHIMQVRGANGAITAGMIEDTFPLWNRARFLMVQGEIPAQASLAAMKHMRDQGGLVILDPAPISTISDAMMAMATVITPNQAEMAGLLGQSSAHPVPMSSLQDGARALFHQFPYLQLIMTTLGKDGVFYMPRDGHPTWIESPKVLAIDPTAAGDAFNGAWAWAVSRGHDWLSAATIGAYVGALTASVRGALPSIPFHKDVPWSAIANPDSKTPPPTS